jgi:predicted small integral membrane protein
MSLRIAKIFLLMAVAFYYTLVVFNNLTDYGSNYQFVHHVLLMDTTFPGNRGMWRAIHSTFIQTMFYDGIIAWEGATALLTWTGVIQLLCAIRYTPSAFNAAKRYSIIALTFGMLLWFAAFVSVGGEWFLMWQSNTWNGEDKAFHIFLMIGIILLLIIFPDTEVGAVS